MSESELGQGRRSQALLCSVISLFPQMVSAVTQFGITRRAVERKLLSVAVYNLRDYAFDRHRTVDDRPYGGGPGMVMQAPVLKACLDAVRHHSPAGWVVYLSPQGAPLSQTSLRALLGRRELILVCGRYEGVDERFVKRYVDQEVSLGDFVISGGELAAMVVVDALARMIPGVCGTYESVQQDSFYEGMLDCPHYTRPAEFEGQRVPEVLLSGDHAAIEQWRNEQRYQVTRLKRPDLLGK